MVEGRGGVGRGRSAGTGEAGWGVYIINYDFITCSQFLGDLLFRGALMNNKRRRRQREEGRGGEGGKKRWGEGAGVIDEASADVATSWPAPELLVVQVQPGT